MADTFHQDPLGINANKRRERRRKEKARIRALEQRITDLEHATPLHSYFGGELAAILRAVLAGTNYVPQRPIAKYVSDLRSSYKYKSIPPEVKQQVIVTLLGLKT
jgi:hypothetical protein